MLARIREKVGISQSPPSLPVHPPEAKTQRAKARPPTNLDDPTVKSLVMFLVFVCALMTIINFFGGVAATILLGAKVGGAFFTASGATLGVSYKLVG